MTEDLTKGRRIASSSLHQRVASQHVASAATLPNRIGLMLDVSGSMASRGDDATMKSKIELLRDAVTSFLQSCDSNTAVAIATFPASHVRLPLTNQLALAAVKCASLDAIGGTPMHKAMADILSNEPITRAVIVSDGCADSPIDVGHVAKDYHEAQISIDCVHIGREESGEALLRDIAHTTGGLYTKFRDTSTFARNFKYLTPALRGLLTSSGDAAKLLGADEVK